jgi:hypothetical protein
MWIVNLNESWCLDTNRALYYVCFSLKDLEARRRFFIFFFLSWNSVLLCEPGWLRTCFEAKIGLKLIILLLQPSEFENNGYESWLGKSFKIIWWGIKPEKKFFGLIGSYFNIYLLVGWFCFLAVMGKCSIPELHPCSPGSYFKTTSWCSDGTPSYITSKINWWL